ncbi:MAG: histidinol-phosphatase HisJ family protein [Clostridiales bacterium]|nr:histidinol-phosphatase HisJ family protein [Clostridiales bacterium]
MQKFLTDVHTHSTFSHDGVDELKDMLATAQRKGVAFYGVSEHFDHFLSKKENEWGIPVIDVEGYFHSARHLQEDYEGVMNVLIGVEFSYIEDAEATENYCAIVKKYRPDFIVNSVHGLGEKLYYYKTPFYQDGKLRNREDAYKAYLSCILKSLDAPYPYDIVGHLGYATRYAPYEDKVLRYEEFPQEFDAIFNGIIQKGKILEVNSATQEGLCVPDLKMLERYFALGGRKISFASDAHQTQRICDKRAEIVEKLKEIGFTHITVPCKGEYIDLEL